MTRQASACNFCGESVPVLRDFGEHPIANHLVDHPNTEVDVYPMIVGCCERCGLTQILQPIDPQKFYTNYATPTAWKREPHISTLVDVLRQRLPLGARILDVGCNDGRFLTFLKEAGWSDLTGLEPTANTAHAAQQLGLRVLNDSLSAASAARLLDEYAAWDCVSLRQVLEHITDLTDFGRALNALLVDGGLLVVEVPDSRVNFHQYDYALWEEHVNYFTPETLTYFLQSWGFSVVHAHESQFSGTCLTVVARKSSNCQSPSAMPAGRLAHEVRRAQTWAEAFPDFRARVQEEVLRRASGTGALLYGVGSRSSNFINIMGLTEVVVAAVDDQPQKQGHFMPRSEIPILSQQEAAKRYPESPLVLLGVNGENEDPVLESAAILRNRDTASILPPSAHLLAAWSR